MRHLISTIIAFALLSTAASAASLSLAVPETVSVGERFSVDVIADTGGVPINSIEAAITYDASALTFLGYQEGAGVVRFWIRQPNAQDGTVSFAGGIPGGASRSFGEGDGALPLVRLLFESKRASDAPLSFAHATMLINDGRGTALPHTLADARIAVSGAVAGAESAADGTPPLPFSIAVLPRDRESKTPLLLSFSTYDRETGISGYRVRFGWGAWQDTQSPKPAPRRIFSYNASVQAVDLAGNAQTARIVVPGIIPIPSAAGVPLAVLLVASGIVSVFVVKRRV